MPTLDLSKMVLLTQREKEKFKEFGTSLFNKALSGLVPPSSQSDYELMKRDPWTYINYQAKKPPTREEIGGIIEKVTEAAPIAFHGSPHAFEKFSMEKVGTGQGAQSYGHGLYFAENPEVAKTYLGEAPLSQASAKVMRERAEKVMANPKTFIQSDVDWAKKTLDQLSGRSGPSMYQVDIPEEHVSKMLDWDKPLSEQGPEIQKAVNKLLDSELPKRFPEGVEEASKWLPWLRNRGTMRGEDIYRALGSGQGGNNQEASAALAKLGIPGIKYLDQGSRAAGQGTRNFVVFDESILKETKRMK